MKITFTGANQEVTGSRHLLEINGKKILLDCGMKQGHREEADKHNRHIPFDAQSVDAVILSHAHIDHCGILPVLVKAGFQGPIYSTTATRDVAELMLLDSAHIGEADALYWKKMHPQTPPVEPLYHNSDVHDTIRLFRPLEYHNSRDIFPGITLTLYDAGHVLGSAMIILDFIDGEQGKMRRLVFTGDLGRDKLPILRDPDRIDKTDILIIESTYGDRLHDDYEKADDKLAEIINKTATRGGKIIIPSFALERAQEIIFKLHLLYREKRIPEMPVYIDSPLTINLTQVFRNHFECFDEEAKEMWHKHEANPFGFGLLKYTRTVDESKMIDHLAMPAIIISASGMCEAGRILHHLKNNIEDHRNTILFVGFQAENTLGRSLVKGAREAKIFGEKYPVKAEIHSIDAFSAHADYQEALEWMKDMTVQDSIFVVHGEATSAQSFADKLNARKKAPHVFIPREGDVVEI